MSKSRADEPLRSDREAAERYFSSFAGDYHRAFEGTGADPLHRLLNRLFRRKTFQRRTALVLELLRTHGVAGREVLDVGSGTGEIAIAAAQLGARVRGIDISPAMVDVARAEAARAGAGDRVTFEVGDLTKTELPRADVVLNVAVIEYYRDPAPLLQALARAAQDLVIIVDTRGPWWRRWLRYGLARVKGFHVYYRPPDDVSAVMMREGFAEKSRHLGHSFTVLSYARGRA